MRPRLNLLETYAAASLNGAAHALERQLPEVLIAGDPRSSQAALTFDDGPHPRDTPALLDVLGRHGVTATFSWLGERAEAHPDLIGGAAAGGHQLMIHGYRHRSFLLERPAELRAMIERTRALLGRYSGRGPGPISSVRPPYGHLSRGVVRRLLEWGYQPVLGSVVPIHWIQPAALTVRQVVTQIEGGSLIVLHEALGGPPVAELADAILTRLAGSAIRFVTVDALRATRTGAGA